MTKGSASMNILWMGAIQLIIFERLAITKRVVHAARTRCGLVRTRFPRCRIEIRLLVSKGEQGHVRRDGTTPDSPRFLRRSVLLYGAYHQCKVTAS
jgi:hypothetical protein